MEVIEQKYFSSNLIERLCNDFIPVKKGQKIFVSGNLYSANYLDYYIESFLRAGAEPLLSLFSDRQLYGGILNGNPEDEVTQWFPRPLDEKKVWVKDRGEFVFDLMVIMLASPFESQDFSEYFSPADLPAFKEKFARFVSAGSRNSWDLTRRGIHKIFLDMPSKWLCRMQNLDFVEIMNRYQKSLSVTPGELIETSEKIIDFFQGGNNVHIMCPLGTDLRFRINGRSWTVGDVPGNNVTILQIPGGEVFCPPLENEATGILHLQFGKRHCVFRFEQGILSDIDFLDTPGGEVDVMKQRYGVGDVQLCEFGIGTNKQARVIPTGPIFEKTFGTVHIGCGCNDTFGGNLKGDKHYDLIIQNPTITLDSKLFDFSEY